MNKSKAVAVSVACATALLVGTVSAVSAQSANGPGNYNNNNNNNGNNKILNLSATPELDSALLFGTGLFGVAGYATLRWRARRK